MNLAISFMGCQLHGVGEDLKGPELPTSLFNIIFQYETSISVLAAKNYLIFMNLTYGFSITILCASSQTPLTFIYLSMAVLNFSWERIICSHSGQPKIFPYMSLIIYPYYTFCFNFSQLIDWRDLVLCFYEALNTKQSDFHILSVFFSPFELSF